MFRLNLRRYLNISSQVQSAVNNGGVVTIESEMLVSGAPYPQNAAFAAAVQNEVRKAGAVPAVTAVIDGIMRVGLKDTEVEQLCKKAVPKASRATLPALILQGKTATTTVGSAMLMAVLSGIHVQAAGGIGGVRAENIYDNSADLQELRQSSVAVFSCGISPFYSAEATLEYLETYGIPVLGINTKHLPRVYCGSSIALSQIVESAQEAAQTAYLKWNLGLRGGVLSFTESVEGLDASYAQNAARFAMKSAEENNINGAALTQYLAAQMNTLTENKAVAAYKASVLNAVRTAAEASFYMGV